MTTEISKHGEKGVQGGIRVRKPGFFWEADSGVKGYSSWHHDEYTIGVRRPTRRWACRAARKYAYQAARREEREAVELREWANRRQWEPC